MPELIHINLVFYALIVGLVFGAGIMKWWLSLDKEKELFAGNKCDYCELKKEGTTL